MTQLIPAFDKDLIAFSATEMYISVIDNHNTGFISVYGVDGLARAHKLDIELRYILLMNVSPPTNQA
jgi:hypothetical protein